MSKFSIEGPVDEEGKEVWRLCENQIVTRHSSKLEALSALKRLVDARVEKEREKEESSRKLALKRPKNK